MIAYWDIEQGSLDWYRIRWAKIGGTTAKQLLNKHEAIVPLIGSEMTESFELEDEGYISAEMQRGHDLEPMARAEVSKYLGIELLQCGWLQSEENELLGISPDGITDDLEIAAEIKCPARKKHYENCISKDIPVDNIDQCLHYFTVNPTLKKLAFASFRPEAKIPLIVKILTLDTKVDMGTKAKPNIKKVSEWVEILRDNANLVKNKVAEQIKSLDTI